MKVERIPVSSHNYTTLSESIDIRELKKLLIAGVAENRILYDRDLLTEVLQKHDWRSKAFQSVFEKLFSLNILNITNFQQLLVRPDIGLWIRVCSILVGHDSINGSSASILFRALIHCPNVSHSNRLDVEACRRLLNVIYLLVSLSSLTESTHVDHVVRLIGALESEQNPKETLFFLENILTILKTKNLSLTQQCFCSLLGHLPYLNMIQQIMQSDCLKTAEHLKIILNSSYSDGFASCISALDDHNALANPNELRKAKSKQYRYHPYAEALRVWEEQARSLRKLVEEQTCNGFSISNFMLID
jgi:hypothetical protein